MTLASYISCLRVVLILPIIYLTFLGGQLEGSFYNYLAFILFLFAGFTDYLDGYIARKTNSETSLGALLDLIADKLLISIILIWLIFLDPFIWLTIPALLIISRELIISSLRQYIIEKSSKNKLNVSLIAKSKTTVQIIGISMFILSRELDEIWILSIVTIWFSAIISLYSLFSYISEWSKHYLN